MLTYQPPRALELGERDAAVAVEVRHREEPLELRVGEGQIERREEPLEVVALNPLVRRHRAAAAAMHV